MQARRKPAVGYISNIEKLKSDALLEDEASTAKSSPSFFGVLPRYVRFPGVRDDIKGVSSYILGFTAPWVLFAVFFAIRSLDPPLLTALNTIAQAATWLVTLTLLGYGSKQGYDAFCIWLADRKFGYDAWSDKVRKKAAVKYLLCTLAGIFLLMLLLLR